MTVQFGATTYTSMTKAIVRAVQQRQPYEHTLKGHLPEDKKTFQVRLELDDSQQNDRLVITGGSQLPQRNHGRGYLEIIPVRTERGDIRRNLKEVLRQALHRAKQGKLVPLQDFPRYLALNLEKIYAATLNKPAQPEALTQANQQADAFLTAEAARIANTKNPHEVGGADALGQYQQIHQTLKESLEQCRQGSSTEWPWRLPSKKS
jgi:hypothetical protein